MNQKGVIDLKQVSQEETSDEHHYHKNFSAWKTFKKFSFITILIMVIIFGALFTLNYLNNKKDVDLIHDEEKITEEKLEDSDTYQEIKKEDESKNKNEDLIVENNELPSSTDEEIKEDESIVSVS